MSGRMGKRQGFLAPLQSPFWVTKIPERYGGVGEAADPGILSVEKRMRAVSLGVVERDRLFQLLPGRAHFSEPQRPSPERKVRLDEETRVARLLGNAEKLLA